MLPPPPRRKEDGLRIQFLITKFNEVRQLIERAKSIRIWSDPTCGFGRDKQRTSDAFNSKGGSVAQASRTNSDQTAIPHPPSLPFSFLHLLNSRRTSYDSAKVRPFMAPKTSWYPEACEVLQPVSQIACFEKRFLRISTPTEAKTRAERWRHLGWKKPEFTSAASETLYLLVALWLVSEHPKTETPPKFQATVGKRSGVSRRVGVQRRPAASGFALGEAKLFRKRRISYFSFSGGVLFPHWR